MPFTRILATALGLTLSLAAGAARAEYPERPVTIVVPFAAGGNIDMTARTVSEGMSKALGQPVIVENKPGAGGMLGADTVAKSKPDGYTMLLASTGSLAAAPALYPTLPFDPIDDLVEARSITRVPLVLVVNPQLQVNSVQELIALAKKRPGRIAMASTGIGTSNHLTGELFQKMSGTQLIHVPYRGSANALTDLLGGQVDIMFDNVPSSLSYIKSGKLKALGVTSQQRSGALPDLPTLSEAGLDGFDASTTTGLALPKGTPAAVVQKIDQALARALAAPEVQQAFVKIGADVSDLPSNQFTQLMQSEGAKWTQIIKDANVKPE